MDESREEGFFLHFLVLLSKFVGYKLVHDIVVNCTKTRGPNIESEKKKHNTFRTGATIYFFEKNYWVMGTLISLKVILL